MTPVYNLRIRYSGLKTQNYDKGLDRFVRMFDSEMELCASLAVYSGRYNDLGWAVYCTQPNRRCCLLDTTYGPSDEEVVPIF
jgi:hypothetical protein